MSHRWKLTVCSLVLCGCLTPEEELDDLDMRDGDEWLDEFDDYDDEASIDELLEEPISSQEPALRATMGSASEARGHTHGDAGLGHLTAGEPAAASSEATEDPSSPPSPEPPSSEPPDDPEDKFSWGGGTTLKPPERVGSGDSSNIKCSDCPHE